MIICYFLVRNLDIEAANNAGIGGILYPDPSRRNEAAVQETYVVSDLIEIADLVTEKQSRSKF